MTNPGQSTPWAKLPIPPESKIPDVPVDIASVMDPLDTLLKNVIGGTSAPTAPLSPNLIQASGQIGSLTTGLSATDKKVSDLTTRVDGLAVPQNAADASWRPWNYSIWSTSTAPEIMHTAFVAARNYPCLMITYFNSCWYWPTLNQYWLLISGLDVKVDGQANYTNRMQAVGAAQFQTLSGIYLEKIPAGKAINMRHTIQCNPGAPSSFQANNLAFLPHIYTIMLPYTGVDISPIPHT